MMRKQTIAVVALVCLLLLLAGCNASTNQEFPSNEFSQKYQPLQVDNINGLAEIDAWEVMEPGDEISAIQYNHPLNRLTVVSEPAKTVTRFAVESAKTIAKKTVDIPDFRVLGMDAAAKKLLVGVPGQMLNEQGKPQEFYHWFALWNIGSGSLDECFSEDCTDELTDPDHIQDGDIGAAIDAETVVIYKEYIYMSFILSPGDGGGGGLINGPDADYWWQIGRIAVNSDQNRLAIVFQEGRIELYKIISEPGILPLGWLDVVTRGKKNQLQPIKAAIFDPDADWLAIVRGQELIIWQIKGWQREIFREQVGNVHGMRFNPAGDLLFVGEDDTIRVIGVKERKVVFELQTPKITSLDLSADNRLLFWGDENGIVHFWGIR